MDISQFILPELLALMPVLFGVGAALKKWKHFKDELIPFALGGIAIVCAVSYCLMVKSQEEMMARIAMAVFQGALLACATVGGHQFIKQAQDINDNQ